jgi:hypothetical protein
LERYCVTILEAERIEAEVREATPGNDRHTPQDGDAPLVA